MPSSKTEPSRESQKNVKNAKTFLLPRGPVPTMDDSSRASVEFREDVRRYLELTEHTEQLQEENEELKIRLETLGNKVRAELSPPPV